MKLARTQKAARPGFTLVELLVVIAIIAILAGLISVGVIKFMGKGPIVANRTEIGQIEAAVTNFQQQFKVNYLPSRIKLCKKLGDYDLSQQLDADSVRYLTRLWPAIKNQDINPNSPTVGKVLWRDVGIDWNGQGLTNNPTVILEGDQCLVFFLGGIPSTSEGTNTCLGFSFNQRDPAGGAGTRTSPLYEFKSGRLYDRTNKGYFSYRHYYPENGQPPYVYFSNYGVRNGYNRYGNSDCSLMPGGPYYEALKPTRYHNPNSFQIISAGSDGKFGPGGLWKASAGYSIAEEGKDDQSNFTSRLMGVAE